MERLFSEDEANQLLPELRSLLERLREAKSKYDAEALQAGRAAAGNGSPAVAVAGSEAARQFSEVAATLESLGVIVRDADSGLVDFAATRAGEPVYLCWRLGEERVAFWHPRDTGFAGRQPL